MTAQANELLRLAIEALQGGKRVSLLLEGDPNWFIAFALEHHDDSAGSALFSARVKASSGDYSRLIARNDKIIAVQII